MPSARRRRPPLAALASALLVLSCSTVPGTGRPRVDWIPASTAAGLGAQAWDQVQSESRVITSGPQAVMVQRVGERLIAAARRLYPEANTDLDWEFALVDDDATVNAFALPGGKAAVYTGILPVAETEDGVAAILGHEVAHVLASHGEERMTQSLIFQAGLTAADLASGDMSPQDRETLLQALGLVGQYGAILPFSRTHESEADELGLMMAADAGYDPRAAVRLWQNMAALGGERPPELLSTHPSEDTRIARLQTLMPEALALYDRARAEGR